MYKIYPFVETKKQDARGESPVYLIISKRGVGKFWLSTGLSSKGKLDGMSMPKGTQNARARTLALCRLLSDGESVLQRPNVDALSLNEVKALLQEELFGIVQEHKTLVGLVGLFAGKKRTSTRMLYGITQRKVEVFDARVCADDVDAEWLERFRLWCMDGGMSVNGAGKELRNIRAVFNWARKEGHTRNYPFLDYHIVEEETRPNDLTADELRMLRDYPCEKWQRKYVDFFMLSFYLAGINPVDLLLLRSDAMQGGHLQFVRQKTNKEGVRKIRTIILPVVDEARTLIEKYPSKEGYLLGFMDGRKDYHSFVKKCNEALKKVGTSEVVPDKTGRLRKIVYHPILPNITLYTARYTFGSIAANDLEISERTIGMCLGHSWCRNVTVRYISNDQRRVDMAVQRVVEYVKEITQKSSTS